jgi:hypothetical protein
LRHHSKISVALFVLLLITLSILLSAPIQYPLSYTQIDLSGATNLAPEEKFDIMAQAEASKKTPAKAYLLIFSDVSWLASILDSGFDIFTQDGSKNSKIEFECIPGFMSTYSLNVQKKSEAGNLLLVTIQDGYLLDGVSTQAEYGIASLSGYCGEAEDIDLNDLKTSTQLQREKEEAAEGAFEEEMQRRKEAGYRQTNDSVIAQLMFRDRCTPLRLNSFNQTILWNCVNGTVATP